MGIMHIIYIAINIHTTIFFQSLHWRIGATSGAGTAYPFGAPEFTPVLEGFVLLEL